MEENQDNAPNNEQNNNQDNAPNNEAKFTQEQFNEALRNEVARKTKGFPNKEELEEFRKWKEKQQQNDEQQEDEQQDEEKNNNVEENQEVDLEKQNAINENKVLKAGVNTEFSEFVTYEVSKMKGDFSKNLTKFLKDNPKYLTSNDNTKFVKKVGSSLNLEGSKPTQTTNQKMNDLIRSARD